MSIQDDVALLVGMYLTTDRAERLERKYHSADKPKDREAIKAELEALKKDLEVQGLKAVEAVGRLMTGLLTNIERIAENGPALVVPAGHEVHRVGSIMTIAPAKVGGE